MKFSWHVIRDLAVITAALMLCFPVFAAEIPQLLSPSKFCEGTSNKVEMIFPQEFVGESGLGGEIAAISARAEGNRSRYFSALEDAKPFPGLYFRGHADKSTTGGGSRHSIAVEWEFFDRGAEASRKKESKLKLERQVEYYQLLRDMEERRLHDDLYRLQQVRVGVTASVYAEEAALLSAISERRSSALEHGYATSEDVAEVQFKYERAAARQRDPTVGTTRVSRLEFELMGRLEALVLHPSKDLQALAVGHSYEYQLQNVLLSRREISPSWTDDLGLGLYVERSNDFYRSDQTIAGVKVRIPLGSTVHFNDAFELERQAYVDQRLAVEIRLAHKIDQLSGQFLLKQSDLVTLNKEYQLLERMMAYSCDRNRFPVTDIDVAPDRKLEELQLKQFEKIRDIYAARLDLLALLFELNSLVKPEQASDLYQLNQ